MGLGDPKRRFIAAPCSPRSPLPPGFPQPAIAAVSTTSGTAAYACVTNRVTLRLKNSFLANALPF